MKIPRILLAAGASGSGKTLITCGLLQALVNRKMKVASFKCGPDYIDPMFHSRVIGTKSRNLDTFFTDSDVTRYLLGRNAADCDIAVMEGVMGFYDGVGGISTKASAYDLADTTDTPVILIVNSRGMSISLAAYIKGFMEYKENSHIKGVIFNQMSPMLYPRMKKLAEEQLGVEVLGYVPKVEDCVIESRHLGLVLPEEIKDLKGRLKKLAGVLEETLEIDRILALAEKAPDLNVPESLDQKNPAFDFHLPQKLKIGVARDEAFCFFYRDNLELLASLGAKIEYFSPLSDAEPPKNTDGFLFCGGYPELHAEELSENQTMRTKIRDNIRQGMPVLAECGGYMYLSESMEDMDGNVYPMVQAVPGNVYRTKKLGRFGYITLTPNTKDTFRNGGNPVRGHEFHYFDSTDCGSAWHAAKPLRKRNWECIHATKRMMAGFPHLYYMASPHLALEFLEQCVSYRKEQEKTR